ncbi:hypothetical protein SynBIOSE41_00187 [Synechococcus sp. BIOS-E4-1]|nr:hypothetical protein SynBIOSE41_00187 [Synechococcus sp. BIOS-E4-1]
MNVNIRDVVSLFLFVRLVFTIIEFVSGDFPSSSDEKLLLVHSWRMRTTE